MDNRIKGEAELEVNIMDNVLEEKKNGVNINEFSANDIEANELEIGVKNGIKDTDVKIGTGNDDQEIEIDFVNDEPEIEIDSVNDGPEIEIDSIDDEPEIEIDTADNKKSPLTANVNGENKNNEIEKKNKNTHIWWGLPANLVTELLAPMLGVVGGCGALLAILWLLDKEFTIPGISKKAKDTRDKLNDEVSMNLGDIKKADPKKLSSIGKTLADSLSNDDIKSIDDKGKKLEDYLIKKLGDEVKNDIEERKFDKIINAINNNINSIEVKKDIKNICATQDEVNASLLKSFLGSKTVENGRADNKAPSMQTKRTVQMRI